MHRASPSAPPAHTVRRSYGLINSSCTACGRWLSIYRCRLFGGLIFETGMKILVGVADHSLNRLGFLDNSPRRRGKAGAIRWGQKRGPRRYRTAETPRGANKISRLVVFWSVASKSQCTLGILYSSEQVKARFHWKIPSTYLHGPCFCTKCH